LIALHYIQPNIMLMSQKVPILPLEFGGLGWADSKTKNTNLLHDNRPPHTGEMNISIPSMSIVVWCLHGWW